MYDLLINILYKITIGLTKKVYFNIKNFYRFLILNYFLSIHRFSSLPYISGDTFRNYSDKVFDETKSFKPEDVKKNDIIFVKSDLIKNYFETQHKKILSKYILISHNSDQNFNSNILNNFDDKIIYWFAQNIDMDVDKYPIEALPIGLENRRYLNSGTLSHFTDKYVKKNSEKKINKIFSSFSPHTNLDKRKDLVRISKVSEQVDVNILPNHISYLRELSKYKFSLCPEGNGVDTHRFWESLMVKTIPITLKNNLTLAYKKHGLPILIISDWEEVKDFTEDNLNDYYKTNFDFTSYEHILKFKYWENLIESKKI